jgi:heme-degrading monooxygenase HmoA
VTHVRIWRFDPAPGHEHDFAAAYACDGPWARLFNHAEGFIGTTLLAPYEPGGPWLTLDRWESRSAFDRFQDTYGETYRSLDVELSHLTTDELFIGAFEEQPG